MLIKLNVPVFFWVVARENLKIQQSLSHPSIDLATLIKYYKPAIDQEDLEESSLIKYWRVFDQEDVAEDVPDAAVTSVKVEVGEIKNDS